MTTQQKYFIFETIRRSLEHELLGQYDINGFIEVDDSDDEPKLVYRDDTRHSTLTTHNLEYTDFVLMIDNKLSCLLVSSIFN